VVGLAITVSGGYFEVLDYLDRLDDLPRIVVVDSIALTPAETATGQQELSVSLNGRMFSTSAPQLAPVPTTAPPASQETVTTSTSTVPVVSVSNG
jgi:hypothetical protein